MGAENDDYNQNESLTFVVIGRQMGVKIDNEESLTLVGQPMEKLR